MPKIRKTRSDYNNVIQVHLVQGHKDIKGNELADKQAKEGAKEMFGVDIKLQLTKKRPL